MFNAEKLEKLHQLTADVQKYAEIASEQKKTATARTGDRKHKVKRPDGSMSTLTENIMWEEVYLLGENSESGKILTKRYPEVFEAFAKQQQNADELKKFCMLEFGIDYTRMTISDYLKLTEAMFEYLLEKNKQNDEKSS